MASNTPIASGSIEQLAAAIAQAINQSGGGGGRTYNPITNQASKQEDPATRVAQIRTYKTAQSANKMMAEMIEIQKKTVRSNEDLERMLDFNRKSLGQAINAYEDFGDAQAALVKELKSQLGAANIPASVKALAGNIDKLEDVLAFSDAAKAMTKLSQSIKESTASGENIEDLKGSIDALKKSLPPGKTLLDVDSSLDSLDKQMTKFLNKNNVATDANGAFVRNALGKFEARDAAGATLAQAQQDRMQKVMARLIQRTQVSQRANAAADKIAMDSQRVVLQTTTKNLTGFGEAVRVSMARVGEWTAKVGTAAYALTKLSEAAMHLYKVTKEAAATGTQTSVGGILTREFEGLTSGTSIETIQADQKKHAQQRNAGGREAYDDAMWASTFKYFKLTGDLDEARKQVAATTNLINKVGVSHKVAIKQSLSLGKTFSDLTYLTGMTVGEINAMNEEFMSGKESRQQLAGLDERGRSLALENLMVMEKENTLRGVMIEQTKEMIKATKESIDARSPKNRLKMAAQLQVLGAAQGISTERSVAVIKAGGSDQYMAKRLREGATKEQAQAELQEAQVERETLGRRNTDDLSGEVDGRGLAVEGMGNKLDKLGVYFDGTYDTTAAKANALDPKAAADFKAGAAALLAGANGTGMMAADMAGNASKTVWGGIALAGAAIVMRKYGLAKLTAVLPGLMDRIRGVTTAIKGTTAAVTAGAGAAGAAAAASRVTTAAGTVTRLGARNRLAVPPRVVPPIVVPPTPGVPSIPTQTSITSKINNLWSSTKTGLAAVVAKAAPAANAASTTAATATAATVRTANAARAAANPSAALPKKIPTATGAGVMGVLSKIALPLTLGLSALNIFGHATDEKQTKGEKTENISKEVGSVAGGLAGASLGAGKGALLGAALGSAVPILGTAAGGIIGGLVGGVGGYFAGDAIGGAAGGLVGMGINATGVNDPAQPLIKTPVVNTPSDPSTSAVMTTDANGNPTGLTSVEPEQTVDPSIMLAQAVTQMNTTLGSIFALMQTSSAEMADGSSASLAMQQRLHRAVKGTGLLGDPAPASQAYNA